MKSGIINSRDATMSLGSLSLVGISAKTALPNVIDVKDSEADFAQIQIIGTTAGAGGTSVSIALEGATDKDSTSWTNILTMNSIALASLIKGNLVKVPIPADNGYGALRIVVTPTGTFTSGVLYGEIDTFTGV